MVVGYQRMIKGDSILAELCFVEIDVSALSIGLALGKSLSDMDRNGISVRKAICDVNHVDLASPSSVIVFADNRQRLFNAHFPGRN